MSHLSREAYRMTKTALIVGGSGQIGRAPGYLTAMFDYAAEDAFLSERQF